MSDLPIRGDISPSLHPEALAGFADALERKPGALTSAQAALGDAYRWLGAVNDAERALTALAASEAPAKRRQQPSGRSEYLGDLRLTRVGLRQFSGHEEELAQAAGVHMERVTKKIDAARGELERTVATLDKAIAFALTDDEAQTVRGSGLAAEVRAHVKSMKQGDRFDFVQIAIKAHDLTTVAAVLDGQPFLSGLKHEEWNNARILATQAFAPQSVKEREAVTKLLQSVDLAGQEVIARYTKVRSGADTPRARANRELAKLKKGAA
ncbi:hypothetical protein EI983_18720 [Roseovarius faecimaris]|uniref:Uncharacterized protein n=1 Tax=Roseovarius faecimaris TaxID=2494550 RepID=A0A6I6ITW4_9RHOB|nr:hypothetical protein [Roseovarius faecimaris]QGY00186.1 hypothetical protein EI983_18720 [Roseovarius faecimaris]